jgi:hypothetical protein
MVWCRTWFGWLTMNIPLPLEEATGLTIHAPAKQHRESKVVAERSSLNETIFEGGQSL